MFGDSQREAEQSPGKGQPRCDKDLAPPRRGYLCPRTLPVLGLPLYTWPYLKEEEETSESSNSASPLKLLEVWKPARNQGTQAKGPEELPRIQAFFYVRGPLGVGH